MDQILADMNFSGDSSEFQEREAKLHAYIME